MINHLYSKVPYMRKHMLDSVFPITVVTISIVCSLSLTYTQGY